MAKPVHLRLRLSTKTTVAAWTIAQFSLQAMSLHHVWKLHSSKACTEMQAHTATSPTSGAHSTWTQYRRTATKGTAHMMGYHSDVKLHTKLIDSPMRCSCNTGAWQASGHVCSSPPAQHQLQRRACLQRERPLAGCRSGCRNSSCHHRPHLLLHSLGHCLRGHLAAVPEPAQANELPPSRHYCYSRRQQKA